MPPTSRLVGTGVLCPLRRFQRNVLDLSVQWRFANLPNHAKLEMVPAARSREGVESTVRAVGTRSLRVQWGTCATSH